MFVPADVVPSAFVGLGSNSFFRGRDSLASQGTVPRLPPDCVAAIPYISEND
jgi:hypothetical protein